MLTTIANGSIGVLSIVCMLCFACSRNNADKNLLLVRRVGGVLAP